MTTVMHPHRQAGTPAAAPTDRRPWDMLMVCTAVYILTAVARLHQLYRPVAALKPTLIFALLGLIVLFLDKNRIRSLRELKDPTSRLVLFIMVWATAGVPFGIYGSHSLFYLYDEAYKVLALFLLVAAAVRNVQDLRRLFYVYGAGIVWLALTALARKHGGMRLGSATYDANDLGMVLVSALPIGIYALTRARGTLSKIGGIVALLVLVTALVETDSRGGFLAFAGVVIYTLFFLKGVKPQWRMVTAVAVIGVLAMSATGTYWERMRTTFDSKDDYNRTSITGRIEIWKRGMGYMFGHPIFGVGVDNFMTAEGRSEIIVERQARGQGTKWSVAHSSWVQAGAEMGIPGLIAVVGLFVMAFFRLRKLARLASSKGDMSSEAREAAGLGAALMGVMVGLSISMSFITQAFGYAPYASLGLVAGLLKVARLHGLDTEVRNNRATLARAGQRARVRPPLSAAGPVLGPPR